MFDTLETLLRSMGGLRTIANEPGPVILELLLIGLSVNWCASVLQGTRGTRPLRGVLTLLVVATLVVNTMATQFGWLRVELLYRFFVVGLALVALVAFQPELRRAVIRAGDVRFLRRGTPQSKVITALVQSARYLSKNRYGGLIAIQRVVDLTPWAEKGTIINAEVTANLLDTIFFPNSPLHDLGVVLAGNRVLAANCQFPVAESDEVGAALGSRHLAAVGMSYESDALVLVVSEETGTISLADNGKLTRFLSIDDLADELGSRLAGQRAPTTPAGGDARPKRWAIGRTLWRLAVVVPLTLMIWIVAAQWTQADSSPVTVQIAVRTSDPQRVVDILEPRTGLFQVVFRGTARAVEGMRDYTSANPLRVDWVVERHPLGRDRRSARELLDGLAAIRARGLSVRAVYPEYVEYMVQELVTVAMPVVADSGSTRLENVRCEPDQVQVTLRRGDLDQLLPTDRAVLAPLEDRLKGAEAGQTFTFRGVRLADRIKGLPVLGMQPKEVSVSLRIVEQRITRRIGPIPVRYEVSPEILERYDIVRVDPQEWLVEVEVEGDERSVSALDPQKVRAYVTIPSDLLTVQPVYRPEVEFELPEGVTPLKRPTVQLKLIPRVAPSP
jgi:diadenylate cyclase